MSLAPTAPPPGRRAVVLRFGVLQPRKRRRVRSCGSRFDLRRRGQVPAGTRARAGPPAAPAPARTGLAGAAGGGDAGTLGSAGRGGAGATDRRAAGTTGAGGAAGTTRGAGAAGGRGGTTGMAGSAGGRGGGGDRAAGDDRRGRYLRWVWGWRCPDERARTGTASGRPRTRSRQRQHRAIHGLATALRPADERLRQKFGTAASSSARARHSEHGRDAQRRDPGLQGRGRRDD